MTTINYALHCKYSGLPIGNLSYSIVAGHMPYISHWDKMIALHPVFSFNRNRLLAFVRGEWNRLAKASADGETTEYEDNLLRVGFLAVLHSLDSIKQDVPSLPPLDVVQSNMSRLFALAYWHYYLDSKRFKFPKYKINLANKNSNFMNIGDYLDLCFDIKRDYEEGLSELVEKEKVDSAERALKALRNSWLVPTSNKQLFRWVAANLPEKYAADKQGWLSTLFCGSERTILEFEKEDIQLAYEIITSECPAGTAILSAVRARLDKIMQIYTDNKEAFNVDLDDYEDSEPLKALRAASAAPDSLVAPLLKDFPTKVAWMRANALYYLQQRAITVKIPSQKDVL